MAPMSSNKRRGPDVSAGSKERNEYIPNFIAKKPFYVAEDSTESDYLEHQRLQKSSTENSQRWYDRGRKVAPAATKFRKGACENCGAMTHKTKECLSRPRKNGAKWTGKDIQADDVIQDLSLGWDAKRDRWNGYDAKDYSAVVDEYQTLEDLKRHVKDGGLDRNQAGLFDTEEEKEDNDEGARYEEETDMGRQQSTSTRNLRIREDTAKYLVNLDLDSAKYDPKTRSMIDSGATADQTAALVAEEGFMRSSGDAAEFERAQRYAWEMQERGDKNRIHLQANPTSGEFFRKKESEEKEKTRNNQRQELLNRYGGHEHLQNRLSRDTIVESERYVEYDNSGAVKGGPRILHKSSYAEDILLNNHKSVWGSWWRDSCWGYSCCHSMIKHSYCTGEDGKMALNEVDQVQTWSASDNTISKEVDWDQEVKRAERAINDANGNASDTGSFGTRKRTLDTMNGGVGVTEAENYRMKRVAATDLMG